MGPQDPQAARVTVSAFSAGHGGDQRFGETHITVAAKAQISLPLGGRTMSTDERAPLTPEEVASEGITALPDKEVISILDLAADVDLAIDGAAPIDLAISISASQQSKVSAGSLRAGVIVLADLRREAVSSCTCRCPHGHAQS